MEVIKIKDIESRFEEIQQEANSLGEDLCKVILPTINRIIDLTMKFIFDVYKEQGEPYGEGEDNAIRWVNDILNKKE